MAEKNIKWKSSFLKTRFVLENFCRSKITSSTGRERMLMSLCRVSVISSLFMLRYNCPILPNAPGALLLVFKVVLLASNNTIDMFIIFIDKKINEKGWDRPGAAVFLEGLTEHLQWLLGMAYFLWYLREMMTQRERGERDKGYGNEGKQMHR